MDAHEVDRPPQQRPGIGALGVFGWILVVLALLLALGGAGLIAVHLTERDDDGYYSSSADRVTSSGYAVTVTGLDLSDNVGAKAAQDVLSRVRLRVAPAGGHPVFVGIARTKDLKRYLGGVARSEVTDVNGKKVSYKQHGGGPPPGPPADQRFWEASASGSGPVTLDWKVHRGNWGVVVMNADAARTVSAEAKVAAKTDALLWIGLGLLALAIALGAGGAAMVLADRRRRSRVAY